MGDTSIASDTVDNVVPSWLTGLCFLAITVQLLRLSMDLIQSASVETSADFAVEGIKDDPNRKRKKAEKNDSKKDEKSDDGGERGTKYGSMSDDGGGYTSSEDTSDEAAAMEESRPLLGNDDINNESRAGTTIGDQVVSAATWSFRLQVVLVIVLLFDANSPPSLGDDHIFPAELVWTSVVVVAMGAFLTYLDVKRHRFGILQRFLYLCASGSLYFAAALLYYQHRRSATLGDEFLMNAVSLFGVLSLVEVPFIEWPWNLLPAQVGGGSDTDTSSRRPSVSAFGGGGKKRLSRKAILTLLKPYFWPDETTESASTNRIRAILTWVCVILSKVCNLAAPILLGWASTALAHEQYNDCIKYSIGYAMIGLAGSAFKEGQSLIYLKVAQAAFVQLSETTFVHLHTLSLDWHLRKKLGEVIRSMDRGIAACDTLMKYLFLWLVPALAECLVVCIIFATYFSYMPLAVAVFYFVWFYIVWTILVTLWRKKFRKAVVKSDNEWHDRCTDSLINFETVKYFTAEEYEATLFGESVKRYQEGSVNVQASLSFLNVSQKALLQVCLATALSMAAWGIKQRVDCCIDMGCDAVSECCQAIDAATCPGMEVGDFVAVLTYTLQLFSPLNFLGSIYNAVVMAIIDLTNLSELLAENPDVTDAPNAIPLPRGGKLTDNGSLTINDDEEYMAPIVDKDGEEEEDDDIAVEFDNVIFHYPSQSSNQGLKGVSFTMKRGTTTAIVGPTGAGKTTISRLFFRFYDVLGGAIKVNGVDVRNVTQKSLRGAIGVVPQNASMFNDTVKTNLLYGRRNATQEELEQAARDAQIGDFIQTLDKGWDTMVGDRGLKLSGGEKQRAAIARCLLKDPPFVLLDEATSALDTLTEKSVQEALDRLGSERTVLVIAHRLGTIRNADNILVLKDGLVAEQGTHDELLEKDGVYAEMWNMQLQGTSGTGSRPGSQLNLQSME